MNFEEVKQLVLESIDESNNMNELIQIIVNKIYQKGFNDATQRKPSHKIALDVR